MKKLTEVIAEKLADVAKEKGYNPEERGKLKELARNYVQNSDFQPINDTDLEKEVNKIYRSFKNFFKKKDQYSAETLDAVLKALDVTNIFFEYNTVK